MKSSIFAINQFYFKTNLNNFFKDFENKQIEKLERENIELSEKVELNERELVELRSSSASRENQLNSDLNESREQIEMLKNELKAAKGRYFLEKILNV